MQKCIFAPETVESWRGTSCSRGLARPRYAVTSLLRHVPEVAGRAVGALDRGDLDDGRAAGVAVAGVVGAPVAMRQAVDVLAARVVGGLDDLAVHLHPAPEVRWVHDEERGAAG